MTEPERRNLSRERRTEILEAFKRCITEHGIEKSSLRRVAAEAGVTQPLLSHHFGSRAGLVDALVRYVLDEYDELLARGLEARSVRNPKTGEIGIHKPGKFVPHFKPGKDLKKRVDAARRELDSREPSFTADSLPATQT